MMNNNILNDFYELGRMGLLTKVSSKVYIPESIISNETPDNIRTVLQQVEYETSSFAYGGRICIDVPAADRVDRVERVRRGAHCDCQARYDFMYI
jgi:hypothetical protein